MQELEKEVADENTLLIKFRHPMKSLSSTIIGGGIKELTHVIFHRVAPDFDANPIAYARELAKRLEAPIEQTAIFLTAVDVLKDHIDLSIDSPTEMRLIATIGLSPKTCIEATSNHIRTSTINILLIAGKRLTDNALIDLASVVSSAKTLALIDLALSCEKCSRRAYTTPTDALIIASDPMSREEEAYGGPATILGKSAAGLVYEAVLSKGLRSLDIETRFRDIFGIELEWVLDTASKVYERAPIPRVSKEVIKKEFELELRKLLKDPNVWSLTLAARSLDWHGFAGAIPILSQNEYLNDSRKILADELLGISLALYINGWKGLLAYYWIDSSKNEIKEFEDKPMFIDDILASLIGGILSKIYDKHLSD